MICGSGTMGRGIALISILSGHRAILFDHNQEALQQAQQLAQEFGHQQLKNEHIFKGILEVD